MEQGRLREHHLILANRANARHYPTVRRRFGTPPATSRSLVSENTSVAPQLQVTGEQFEQESTETGLVETQTGECSICIEEKHVNSFAQITQYCNHERQTCTVCIQH